MKPVSSDIQVWHPVAAQGVTLIHAHATRHEVPRQRHPEMQIVLLESGARRFYHRGGWQTAGAGDLVLIGAGEAHGSCALDAAPVTARILCAPEQAFGTEAFQTKALEAEAFQTEGLEAENRAAPLRFSALIVRDMALASSFAALHRVLETPADPLETQTRLRGFLARLRQEQSVQPPPPHMAAGERNAVRLAREYLHACYTQTISLDELARVAGLSGCYLNRVFAREVGLPPYAYLLSLRLSHAKTLLRQGVAAGDVALLIGFYDLPHFSRYVSVSPARYARSRKMLQN